jgi:predicted ATPase
LLTHIEIDGFKTFNKFSMDLQPFVAVLGANATGKSNLFDAIQFIRRLTENNLNTAVQQARGELEDLFRHRRDGSSVLTMRFVVEVLLEPRVRDPWGTEVDLTQSRLRYELHVARREDADGNVRLFIDYESAAPVRRGAGDLVKRWGASKSFQSAYMRDGKRTSAFLETLQDSARGRLFQIRQDGVQGRARPAEAAEATVLSSMNSAEFKHLYALREEIVGWRFLQLEPQALRQPGERFGEERLLPDGSNLARVLHRIQRETATAERPEGILADLSNDLSSLIPGISAVQVRENEQTKKWEILVLSRDSGGHRADVASDGTLRVLALLVALYDPKYRGLICFEEPENGVHPLRLKRLVRYLRALVTDPSGSFDAAEPLAQVMINSHSPVVLSALPPSSAFFLDTAALLETFHTSEGPRRAKSYVSRMRRVVPIDQIPLVITAGELPVGEPEVRRYKAAALLEDEE